MQERFGAMADKDHGKFDHFKDPEPEEVRELTDLPLYQGSIPASGRMHEAGKKKVLLFPFLLLIFLLVAVCVAFVYLYISQERQFKQELDRAHMLIRTQEAAVADLEMQLATEQTGKADTEGALRKLQTRYSDAKRNNIVREGRLESSLTKTEQEATRLKENHESTLGIVEELQGETSKWQTVAAEDSELRKQLIQKIETLKRRFEKSEAQIAALMTRLNNEISENARLQSKINTLTRDKSSLRDEMKRLQARLNALLNTPPQGEGRSSDE